MTTTLRTVIFNMGSLLGTISIDVFTSEENTHGRWSFDTDFESDMEELETLLDTLDELAESDDFLHVGEIVINKPTNKKVFALKTRITH